MNGGNGLIVILLVEKVQSLEYIKLKRKQTVDRIVHIKIIIKKRLIVSKNSVKIAEDTGQIGQSVMRRVATVVKREHTMLMKNKLAMVKDVRIKMV